MKDQLKEDARLKIQRVFSYIRELTKLRTPPTSQLSSYEWHLRFSTLPNYPTIQPANVSESTLDSFDGVILRVTRPNETPCPPLPKSIEGWVEGGWDRLESDPKNISARNFVDGAGQTVTERFDASNSRVSAFREWKDRKALWQLAERPVREAALVFSDFFKLQAQLQRESEKFQLYLGEGHLVWESAIEPVDHPILLQKVELEFNPSVPEFIVRETDDSPELFSTLFRHHELDGSSILACKSHLADNELHPLANGKTVEFLKFCVHRFFPNGLYFDSRDEISGSAPTIYRDPVIFLGTRTQEFSEALDKLIEAMPNIQALPTALLRIVGIDEMGSALNTSSTEDASDSPPPFQRPEPKIDFLLTKPANQEQEGVITKLEQTGSVLVALRG